MIQSEYWISELAELSGVSTRTIRYYIQEGLLPQPEVRGKYAVFNDEYMQRLRLIKYLKDAYLPLNRIRELLDSLPESQVVPLLNEFEADPVSALSSLQALPILEQQDAAPSQPEPEKNLNALEYINALRENRTIREKKPSTPAASPAPQTKRQYLHLDTPAIDEWRRVELVPGLELHLRLPVNTRVQKLVDQLIDLARNFNL
jgi:DNA-binding transcriptional MerR regulator